MLLAIFIPLAWCLAPARKEIPAPPSQHKLPEQIQEREPWEDIAFQFTLSVNPQLPSAEVERTAKAIIHAGNKYNVDPWLILGVILAESTGRWWVVNKKCIGYMQIHTYVWDVPLKKKGIISNKGDYYRIENNIEAGTYILSLYIHNRTTLRQALIAYSGHSRNNSTSFETYYKRCTSFLE